MKILRSISVAGAALVISLGVASRADAHNKTFSATCADGISINLSNYNAGVTNHVKVTLGTATKVDQNFGSSYSATFPNPDKTVLHAYTAVVTAGDGAQFGLNESGTIPVCSTPATTIAPTTTGAPTSTTSPPTTTTTPPTTSTTSPAVSSTAAPTTAPVSTSPASTVPTTTAATSTVPATTKPASTPTTTQSTNPSTSAAPTIPASSSAPTTPSSDSLPGSTIPSPTAPSCSDVTTSPSVSPSCTPATSPTSGSVSTLPVPSDFCIPPRTVPECAAPRDCFAIVANSDGSQSFVCNVVDTTPATVGQKPTELPATGSDTAWLAYVAGVLLALGIVTVVIIHDVRKTVKW